MSSFSVPVERVELSVIKRPSRDDLNQPVIKILCRLEPYGSLVELCWRRSTRRPFPEILNGVDQGSVLFVSGRFAATICKYSNALLVMKSIDARKIIERESRDFQDGCSLPLVVESEQKSLSLRIKYYETKVELNKVMERLEKMKISDPLAPAKDRPDGPVKSSRSTPRRDDKSKK
jgi:hypothetical protein